MQDPWSVDEEIRKQVEFHESSYVPKFPKSSPGLRKNVARKVTDATKREVYERDDGKCVCCGTSQNLERTPHHAYFGYEANHNPNRNDADQLVTICRDCHSEIHFQGDPNGYRGKCVEYLSNLSKGCTSS